MEIAQQVKLREVELGTQTFIINGQQQQITNKVQCLVCPNCNKRFYQFEQQNMSYLEAYQTVVANKATFETEFKYCPVCGQKLEFTFDIIDSEDFSVVDAEEQNER